MSYFAYLPTRNGSAHLQITLRSLLDQTMPPRAVLIVDDGSDDDTKAILKYWRRLNVIHILTLPNQGRDFRRIVYHYNRVLRYIEAMRYQFFVQLVLADDIYLPPTYMKRMLDEFTQDPRLVVASGRFETPAKTPHGAGRVIRDSFMRQLGYRYPLSYAYESWPMLEAYRRGFKSRVYNDVHMVHLRPLGSGHAFREFGRAMYCLGYPILYVLGRSTLYFLKGQPRIGATLLGDYLFSRFRDDPMNQPLDAAFRHDTKQHFQRVMTRKIFNRSAHH